MTYQQLWCLIMLQEYADDEENAEKAFKSHWSNIYIPPENQIREMWKGILEKLNNALLDQAIESLNNMIETDRLAMHALVETRVPCQDMLSHPTVRCVRTEDGKGWEVGLLGILNGLFGAVSSSNLGAITAVFDDLDMIKYFRRTDSPPTKEKDDDHTK